MATKKTKKDNGLLAQAKVANKVAIEVGEELINMGLTSAKAGQGIYEKVLTGGVKLFGMQQKFVLDTLETVVTSEQFKTFVELPGDYFNKVKIATEAKVEDLKTDGVKIVKKAANFIEDAADKVEDTVEGVVDKVEDAVEDVVEKVEDAVEASVKAGTEDLTKINGIGPKTAEILVEAGYTKYAQIATANVKEIEKVLEKAGSRYAGMDPAPWIEQAAFAAAGDWKGLEAWIEANL